MSITALVSFRWKLRDWLLRDWHWTPGIGTLRQEKNNYSSLYGLHQTNHTSIGGTHSTQPNAKVQNHPISSHPKVSTKLDATSSEWQRFKCSRKGLKEVVATWSLWPTHHPGARVFFCCSLLLFLFFLLLLLLMLVRTTGNMQNMVQFLQIGAKQVSGWFGFTS